jgi:hypothetical protein
VAVEAQAVQVRMVDQAVAAGGRMTKTVAQVQGQLGETMAAQVHKVVVAVLVAAAVVLVQLVRLEMVAHQ